MEERQKRLRELEREMSPRHLRFARLVAEGDQPYYRCYMDVYPDSTQRAAETSAARLLGNARIKEYVELITGASVDEAIVNRQEIVYHLLNIVKRYGDDPKASNAVASAMKTLLQYMTPNIPKRVELSGPGGGPVESKSTGGLTDETMKSIIVSTLGLTEEQAKRFFEHADHAKKEA